MLRVFIGHRCEKYECWLDELLSLGVTVYLSNKFEGVNEISNWQII